MTCQYSEINPHDALYIAARKYPGGIEALAQRMQMSPNVLRNKLRPGIATHHTNLEEFSTILEFLHEAHVPEADLALRSLCWQHGYIPVKLPEVTQPASELLAMVLNLLREEGELAGSIQTALADDGRIDDRERESIEIRLQRCVDALLSLRERVSAKHASDFRASRPS